MAYYKYYKLYKSGTSDIVFRIFKNSILDKNNYSLSLILKTDIKSTHNFCGQTKILQMLTITTPDIT